MKASAMAKRFTWEISALHYSKAYQVAHSIRSEALLEKEQVEAAKREAESKLKTSLAEEKKSKKKSKKKAGKAKKVKAGKG